MDASGLLTVLAILVAGYSLLSDEKRLDIKLRLSWLDYVLAGGLVLAILVVVYSPVILNSGFVEAVEWRWGFEEETMVFTLLTAIIVFFGWKVSRSKLPAANYSKWSDASDLYLRSKKFDQLGYLLDRYHGQLFDVIDRQVWYVRVHNFLRPQIMLLILTEEGAPPFHQSALVFLRKILAKPFPNHSQDQEVVKNSISRLLKSKAFVAFLAETYPIIGAKATCLQLADREEYVNIYFDALISDSSSCLYRELKDNQSSSYTGEYYLDASNPLLNFYFKDISVAQDVGVWQPIGEYVIAYIKRQRGKDSFYNQPDGRFSYDEERWSSPIFIGILFFRVMVSIGIFRRVQDHFWLMYCGNILEEILESLEHADSVDKSSEFPSKFDYLLYEVFSTCRDWTKAAQYVDYSTVLPEDFGNYPEHMSARTFGSMLRNIVKSDKLEDSQKIYFLTMAVKTMRELDQKSLETHSLLVFDNCVKRHEDAPIDINVAQDLNVLYRRVDHVLKSDTSTFEKSLAAALRTK